MGRKKSISRRLIKIIYKGHLYPLDDYGHHKLPIPRSNSLKIQSSTRLNQLISSTQPIQPNPIQIPMTEGSTNQSGDALDLTSMQQYPLFYDEQIDGDQFSDDMNDMDDMSQDCGFDYTFHLHHL
jgi:hypothetical protein